MISLVRGRKVACGESTGRRQRTGLEPSRHPRRPRRDRTRHRASDQELCRHRERSRAEGSGLHRARFRAAGFGIARHGAASAGLGIARDRRREPVRRSHSGHAVAVRVESRLHPVEAGTPRLRPAVEGPVVVAQACVRGEIESIPRKRPARVLPR